MPARFLVVDAADYDRDAPHSTSMVDLCIRLEYAWARGAPRRFAHPTLALQ
jgi:hypothetical protein